MSLRDSWPADIYVLVPAYNAARSLRRLIPDLLVLIPRSNLCVADDGSADETRDVCVELGVECVSNPVNKGKGAALVRGFAHLLEEKRAQWIVTMDADGQHSPQDLGQFLREALQYPDAGVIVGRRIMRPGTMPLARICSNVLTSAILSLATGQRILDSQCGFRAYSSGLLRAAPCKFERFEMESEILMRACRKGFSVNFVPVQTLYFSTQSHISHVADTLRWLRAILTVFLELRRPSP